MCRILIFELEISNYEFVCLDKIGNGILKSLIYFALRGCLDSKQKYDY